MRPRPHVYRCSFCPLEGVWQKISRTDIQTLKLSEPVWWVFFPQRHQKSHRGGWKVFPLGGQPTRTSWRWSQFQAVSVARSPFCVWSRSWRGRIEGFFLKSHLFIHLFRYIYDVFLVFNFRLSTNWLSDPFFFSKIWLCLNLSFGWMILFVKLISE